MNKIYLGNAFSLQMIAAKAAVISISEVDAYDIPIEAESCIDHAGTAKILSGLLGRKIACNRMNIWLGAGDTLYVVQFTGGRLPEGATTLPEGFSFKFMRVIVTIAV